MATRIAINPRPTRIGFAAMPQHGVQILAQKPGPVSVIDQAKQYYKAAIALVGGLLAIAPQIVVPEPAAGYVSTAVVILTGIMTYLKANEIWVADL